MDSQLSKLQKKEQSLNSRHQAEAERARALLQEKQKAPLRAASPPQPVFLHRNPPAELPGYAMLSQATNSSPNIVMNDVFTAPRDQQAKKPSPAPAVPPKMELQKKRAAEVTGSPRKKSKLNNVACPLCRQTPHHVTSKCPRVLRGAGSIQIL